MRVLEEFLKPTQSGLFKMLGKFFKGKAYTSKDSFILVKGEAPIMLVAHLDTVHREPVREICKSKGGEILMSPQGIGGDDRCGVYALVNAYEMSQKKPWLLFTCDEEVGGVGAHHFCTEHSKNLLPKGLDKLKLLIEIDRRGSNDAVYYDCDNAEFEKYISSKGFVTAYGSFSDISLVAPELGVAAVNLSSGYYNPHTLHEYINRRELEAVLIKVVEIIADAAQSSFPLYRYIEKVYEIRQWAYSSFPKIDTKKLSEFKDEEFYFEEKDTRRKLPSEYSELYDELLEFYTVEELEAYRENFGDEVIYQIYIDEYGPFYAEYER